MPLLFATGSTCLSVSVRLSGSLSVCLWICLLSLSSLCIYPLLCSLNLHTYQSVYLVSEKASKSFRDTECRSLKEAVVQERKKKKRIGSYDWEKHGVNGPF